MKERGVSSALVIIVAIIAAGAIGGVYYLFVGGTGLKEIQITGSDVVQTIDDTEPIRLDIVGSNCIITVSATTVVEEIEITGSNNIVNIPASANPAIDITGSNNEIIKY